MLTYVWNVSYVPFGFSFPTISLHATQAIIFYSVYVKMFLFKKIEHLSHSLLLNTLTFEHDDPFIFRDKIYYLLKCRTLLLTTQFL